MTKLAAVGLPTIDDAEKLLLTELSLRYASADGNPGSRFMALSPDGQGLALMDLETREVFPSLPIEAAGPIDVRPVITVSEELLANPLINPAQEEKVTSILVRSDDTTTAFNRIPGTDRFICTKALSTLEPDSMSYSDSNVRRAVEDMAQLVRDSVIVSRHRNEVYNIARPEKVYDLVPGYEVVFGDVERTPGNDSYPDIKNDELKPPEHGAVMRAIEPVPEHEWLDHYHEKKAAWEDRMAQKAREQEAELDRESEPELEEIGIG